MTGAATSPAGMALRYVAFAIVATVTNIAVQEIAIHASPVAPLTVSILAGTVAGFAVKYVLDKLYVFADAYENHASEARKVALYGAFSVLTTMIFWGCEIAAWRIWGTTAAKYTGAVVGLAIGYAAKFALDRKYVFRATAPWGPTVMSKTGLRHGSDSLVKGAP